MNLKKLETELKAAANPEHAKILQRFFKTGKGEYGEGDIFMGIKIPPLRLLAKKYYEELDLADVKKLLSSSIHEERMISLFMLIFKFEKENPVGRKKIFDFYIKNRKNINNWDLVDLTAPKICGAYLYGREKTLLYELAESENIWERRIAVLSTFYFIKNREYGDSLNICRILINDKHDLLQKATGWMLREIGKRDMEVEEEFLAEHYKSMPRTMLRYAIEKFPEDKRLYYMGRAKRKFYPSRK